MKDKELSTDEKAIYNKALADCKYFLDFIAVNVRLNDGKGADIIVGKDLEELALDMYEDLKK